MRRHRRQMTVISDLNLTNLLDTAFVLLIAFMLVSPVIRYGLDLELPKVSAAAPLNTQSSKPMTIKIKKSPAPGLSEPIYVGDSGETRVDMDALKTEIQRRRLLDPKLEVVVEMDKDATYNSLAQVLAVLKNIGVQSIGLPTQPEDQPAKSDEGEKHSKKKKS